MYLNTRDGEAYKEYCKVRNQVRTLTRKITKQFEKQIAQQVKTPRNVGSMPDPSQKRKVVYLTYLKTIISVH